MTVEDAMVRYLQEFGQLRELLDNRYDDLRSGQVESVDEEEAFANRRQKAKTAGPAAHNPSSPVYEPKRTALLISSSRGTLNTYQLLFPLDLPYRPYKEHP
jgi:hypothetical protein